MSKVKVFKHIGEGYNYMSFDGVDMVKDVDTKKGIVKAYYAVWNIKDSDGDIIERGAFNKSIADRGVSGAGAIKHFKWHDSRFSPGKLQELGEDSFGAWFESKLSKSDLGRNTLIEYDEGIISEHSHGYKTINEYKDNYGINHIKESFLREVSSLTGWGANSFTRTEYVKSLSTNEDILFAYNEISKRLKLGNLTDEYLKILEERHNEISQMIKTLNEPSQDTQKNEPFDAVKYMLNNLKFI